MEWESELSSGIHIALRERNEISQKEGSSENRTHKLIFLNINS
jgi:hypothetical protein